MKGSKCSNRDSRYLSALTPSNFQLLAGISSALPSEKADSFCSWKIQSGPLEPREKRLRENCCYCKARTAKEKRCDRIGLASREDLHTREQKDGFYYLILEFLKNALWHYMGDTDPKRKLWDSYGKNQALDANAHVNIDKPRHLVKFLF